MARLRRTARKSVPGGPYRVEGFQLQEQVVQVMSELAPRKWCLKIQWVICRFPAGIDIDYLIIFWVCKLYFMIGSCNLVSYFILLILLVVNRGLCLFNY